MNDASLYAFEQRVPIDAGIYARIRERLRPEPLAGLVVHLVVRAADGSLRYIDVWESKEACDRASRDRIHPAVQAVLREAGIRPGEEPKRIPLDLVDLRRAP